MEEFEKFYNRVLRFLSFRPRSQKEITDFLNRKKVSEITNGEILRRLKELNFVNDEEFARWWIEQRNEFSPRGVRLLKIELEQKGISKDLIVKLLDGYMVKETEFEAAKKLVEKRLERYHNLPLEEKRQKLTAFLARRGFDWETIKNLTRSLIV